MIITTYFGSRVTLVKQSHSSNPLRIISLKLLIPIIIFTFFSGVRYNVGVDHLNYLKEYEYLMLLGKNYDDDFELGFYWISSFFAENQFHFAIYFSFLAMLQVIFIYLSFKKEKYVLPYIGVLLILSLQYFFFMNGIRQGIAFSLFLYSINYLVNRKFIWYTFIILAASLIHISALILLPLYLIDPQSKRSFFNAKLQLLVIALSILVGTSNLLNDLLLNIDMVISLGFDSLDNLISNTLSRTQFDIEENLIKWGPSRVLELLLNVILVLYSAKFLSWGSNKVYIIYILYFCSIILEYMFFKLHGIMRVVLYFSLFRFVIFSYFLYYLIKVNKTKRNLIVALIIILLFIVIFLIRIYVASENSSILYNFFWDFNQSILRFHN